MVLYSERLAYFITAPDTEASFCPRGENVYFRPTRTRLIHPETLDLASTCPAPPHAFVSASPVPGLLVG